MYDIIAAVCCMSDIAACCMCDIAAAVCSVRNTVAVRYCCHMLRAYASKLLSCPSPKLLSAPCVVLLFFLQVTTIPCGMRQVPVCDMAPRGKLWAGGCPIRRILRWITEQVRCIIE